MMMSEARAVLKLNSDSNYHAALTRLEEFSHIWVVFVFHKNSTPEWHPMIEPPKVDLKEKVGVFASRSPHRPNPIGISAVKLEKIDRDATGGIEIHLSGVDLLDGTPVLDIKPYLPYADQILDANSGWAEGEIQRYPVEFSAASLKEIETISERHPDFKLLIEQMLAWDPRPTSQRKTLPIPSTTTEGMEFAFRVLDCDVRWQVRGTTLRVLQVVDLRACREDCDRHLKV